MAINKQFQDWHQILTHYSFLVPKKMVRTQVNYVNEDFILISSTFFWVQLLRTFLPEQIFCEF